MKKIVIFFAAVLLLVFTNKISAAVGDTAAAVSDNIKLYGYVIDVTDVSTKKVMLSLARGEVQEGDELNVFNSEYNFVTKITVGTTLGDSSFSKELTKEVYDKIRFGWIVSTEDAIDDDAKAKLEEAKQYLIRKEKAERREYRQEEKRERMMWREIEKNKALGKKPPVRLKRPVVIINK